jgi:hypothetical protein
LRPHRPAPARYCRSPASPPAGSADRPACPPRRRSRHATSASVLRSPVGPGSVVRLPSRLAAGCSPGWRFAGGPWVFAQPPAHRAPAC